MASRNLEILFTVHRVFLSDSTVLDSTGDASTQELTFSPEDSLYLSGELAERSDQAGYDVLITRLGLVHFCAQILSKGLSGNRQHLCRFSTWVAEYKYSHLKLPSVVIVVQSLCRFQLLCPMNYSPPGSSVHGIFQARILEQFAIFFSRGSSKPRGWTCVSYIAIRFFMAEPPGNPVLS